MTPNNDEPKSESAESAAAAAEAAAAAAPAEPTTENAEAKKAPEPIRKSCSPGLTAWMRRNQVSIAFTSYQSGRLYLLGSDPTGRLSFFERIFERAMGIVGNAQRIYLGGLYQLWRFENVLRERGHSPTQFDKCYVPRNAQTIGDLDIHELGIRKNGKVVFVNTKYSCLAEPSQTHSFKAIWKPDFISKLAPEDRCHLNGLAMVDGKPKYVTAVCKSDTVDGWRDRRHDGGVVIDIETNEIVCEGLSMPHSPRWANGKLWVLNAGTGHLGWVDFENEEIRAARVLPGLPARAVDHRQRRRGRPVEAAQPALRGPRPPEELEAKDSEAWCGVQIVDLKSGSVVEWVRLDGPVSELFDVAFLDEVKCPMALGQQSPENLSLISIEGAQAQR